MFFGWMDWGVGVVIWKGAGRYRRCSCIEVTYHKESGARVRPPVGDAGPLAQSWGMRNREPGEKRIYPGRNG